MKFIHGISAEPGYHEKSLLDHAIDKYASKADEYYKKLNETECAPEDVRGIREKELAKIKRELEFNRMSAECMSSVQAQLDEYRERGRRSTAGARSEVVAKQKALMAEGHHQKDLDLLEKFMLAAIKIRPDSNHTAHHIVPGKGKTKDANLARVRLHRFGIRINDPDNGVWLPTYKKHTPLWSMPNSKGHLEYHTHGYEGWVRRKLQARSSEHFIRTELNIIGKLLRQNKIPPEAKKKK